MFTHFVHVQRFLKIATDFKIHIDSCQFSWSVKKMQFFMPKMSDRKILVYIRLANQKYPIKLYRWLRSVLWFFYGSWAQMGQHRKSSDSRLLSCARVSLKKNKVVFLSRDSRRTWLNPVTAYKFIGRFFRLRHIYMRVIAWHVNERLHLRFLCNAMTADKLLYWPHTRLAENLNCLCLDSV